MWREFVNQVICRVYSNKCHQVRQHHAVWYYIVLIVIQLLHSYLDLRLDRTIIIVHCYRAQCIVNHASCLLYRWVLGVSRSLTHYQQCNITQIMSDNLTLRIWLNQSVYTPTVIFASFLLFLRNEESMIPYIIMYATSRSSYYDVT